MKSITVEKVKARLEAGEQLNLVDVREPFEHENFNIGGILLPLGNVQAARIDDIEDFKGKEVICYCRSGIRSYTASVILEQLGFTDVANLEGGMLEWHAKFVQQ